MSFDPASPTIQTIEAGVAGESMANRKYLFFARRALGHLDLLYPKAELTVERMLQLAIDGETYEYTEMYPKFRHLAEQEGHTAAVRELDEQIAESQEHAERFAKTLATAAKRFAALAKVEEKHANHYRDTLTAHTGA